MFFSALDTFFLVIILLISSLSMIRGFLQELVSIFAFILSVIITYKYTGYLASPLTKFLVYKELSYFLSGIVIFIICLFLLKKIIGILVNKIDFSISLNLLLGFLIGATKGIVMVCIICWFIVFLYPDIQTGPIMLQESYFLKFFINTFGSNHL